MRSKRTFGHVRRCSVRRHAISSGAQLVGLAAVRTGTCGATKQVAGFGLVQNGQKLAGRLAFIGDVHPLGLPAAQGLNVASDSWSDCRPMAQSGAAESLQPLPENTRRLVAW